MHMIRRAISEPRASLECTKGCIFGPMAHLTCIDWRPWCSWIRLLTLSPLEINKSMQSGDKLIFGF